MKVLLLSVNKLNTPYPVYPLGLDYVAAALMPRHTVKIVDLNCTAIAAMEHILDDFKPDAVGVSLRNIDNTDTTDAQGYLAAYQQVIQRIRRHTTAPVILGGAGFSIFPKEIMAALGADYGIVGEGERMVSLLDALSSGEPLEALAGLVTANGICNAPIPLSKDFQRHFDPAYGHLPYYLQRGGMLNLQTKRGCPFRCVYCTYPRIEGHRLRLMDPESVADTAKLLQDAGAKYFFIADSAFNSDLEHSLAVASQFRKKGVSIPWGAFLAPVQFPPNYFKSLAQAGMTHAEFGTESLCNRVLREYGKPFDRESVLKAHENAVAAGLHVAHYFLLGGPGETPETLKTTLSHIDKLEKSVLFLFCGIRIYPHTRLYKRAKEEGQICSDQDLLEPIFYQSPAIGSDEIIKRVSARADGRINWVIGSGGDRTETLLQRMYKRGHTGPLWELLVR